MSATATKETKAQVEGKHYFHSPKQGGVSTPTLSVFLPSLGIYARFASNYYETDNELLAEELLAVRDAGYCDFAYETPEQRAAAARRKREEEAAASRGKDRLAHGREKVRAEERQRAEAIFRDPLRAH